MRYVSSYCLRENMKLAKNIYSDDERILLATNVLLTKEYIEGLHKLGISGVYIEDEISENINVKSVISDHLRIEAVKSIKKVYNNPNSLIKNIDKIENIAIKIMDEILNSKNIMISMIDMKTFDNYTYYHSVNVAVLSAVIGISLNFEKSKLEKLISAALLHDIGKIFISQKLLSKKEKLTKEENDIFKTHSEQGYKYIKNHYSIPVTAYVGILQHHERYDGKGYPDGKKGNDISHFARIISICNVYDNLISKTPYKEACIPSEAIEYIMANSGTEFESELVNVFLKKVSPYPLGTILRLSDGKQAIVIENNEACSMRPKVRIIDEGKILDLTYDSNSRNITIIGVENI
jgi:HD-GYP domain-containing protein (c-di-GMP phosphodiesterase class II)